MYPTNLSVLDTLEEVKQASSEAEIAASSEAAILDDDALLNLTSHASLRSRNLRQFSLSLLITCRGTAHLKTLDVSHNELFEMPGQTTKIRNRVSVESAEAQCSGTFSLSNNIYKIDKCMAFVRAGGAQRAN